MVGYYLAGDESEQGLFELTPCVEFLEVFQALLVDEVFFSVGLDPLVVECLFSSDPGLGVVVEHSFYEVFGVVADLVPVFGVEVDLALFDPLEDFLLVVASEGRVAAQKYI